MTRVPVLLALLCAGALDAAEPPKAHPAEQFVYLPPALERRVVFYHSFERGVAEPEIDLIGAKIICSKPEPAEGLAGRGLKRSHPDARKGPLHVASAALSAHRPMTVMMWWRIDEPMKPETCYHLIRIGDQGYIGAFVRGKGKWCALTQPTFIFQVYRFPSMTDRNDRYTGAAWVEPGEWHHAAVTVAAATDVRVYWDAKERIRYSVKGRPFRKGDTAAIALGPTWLWHPMTIDEVVVLDVALGAHEVRRYVEATRRLAEVRAPMHAIASPE